ncbi:hypothetical protein [Peptacetobacter sp.]|uniref:hypothetical protein n=1 Tax=Peptacetobacter sp. TaxID=2991975 RepID=UPI0026189882|nr:hypothetical protein [Peptacetobacter sp.]
MIKNYKNITIEKVSEKYNELINKKSGKCSKILFLISDSKLIEKVKNKINKDKYFEEPIILTYISFIKKELEKYWTLINKEIESKENIPHNLTYSVSEYILKKKVEKYRYKLGYFEDITGTTDNIYKSISSNLKVASFMDTDIFSTGEKIYYTKKNKDNLKRMSYTQNDEIISEYVDELIKDSTLDLPLSVYLYTTKLLKNKIYIESILKRYDYLIIDSIEKISNSELELIKVFEKLGKEVYIYGDLKKDFSILSNFDINNIKENLLNENNSNIKLMDLDKNKYVEYNDLMVFSDNIKECYQVQLYNEMIDEVVSKIYDMSKSNHMLKNTVLLVPPGSSIFINRLSNRLKELKIKFFTTNTDFKISDYNFSNALIIASSIYSSNNKIIFSKEEYVEFLSLILNVNKINANKIYNKNIKFLTEDIYMYDKLKNYNEKIDSEILEYMIDKIFSCRDKELKKSEFMRRFYIEILLPLEKGIENIDICKKLIEECEKLEEAAEYNIISYQEIDIILKNISKDYITFKEMKKVADEDALMITTPYYYINSLSNRKVQLWVDCGNSMWNPKIEKEINNSIVLRKSYKERNIFTDTDEENIKKYYMNNQLYSLLSSSEEVYVFKSDYSINGYLQESLMYTRIINLMDKDEI